ncbi:hypothetical protein [Saccharopolyspora hordei]|uniref:Mce-associated membrane protein n=1 Tax=Saccharopolyspora hordei TaxID=1838 RepID=A0A853ADD9_9PSEU|nr:hypothetical protein [Saccharopolyspora hordei]NYI82484.1 Mce-associated membrane protein [Saccharopolyspora hordei]
MPPTNRRPNKQPTRRPKVAGLRNRQTREERLAETRGADAQPAGTGGAVTPPERADEAAAPERSEAPAADAPTSEEGAETVAAEGSEPAAEAPVPERGAETVVAEGGESAAEDGGSVEGTTAESAEPEQAEAPSSAEESAAGSSSEKRSDEEDATGRRPVWPLWVATVVLAGLAVWFGVEAYTVRYTGPAANEALVSAGKTSEVSGQVSEAVEKLFSYDFNDTGKTEAAARELLTGPAVQRYEELFAVVKQQAPEQQLIVTTTVKDRAVTRLQGDRAELLLFVDQHARRANAPGENAGPAQISVSAEKHGDVWKISQITLR